jgi:hypothetical protein
MALIQRLQRRRILGGGDPGGLAPRDPGLSDATRSGLRTRTDGRYQSQEECTLQVRVGPIIGVDGCSEEP